MRKEMKERARPASEERSLVHERGELYAGPLPHPDIMKGYAEVDPSIPERIMRMTEAYAAANIETQRRNSKTNFITSVFGQVFTLAISLCGIGAAVYFVHKGVESAAIASIFGGLSPIILAAVRSFKKS